MILLSHDSLMLFPTHFPTIYSSNMFLFFLAILINFFFTIAAQSASKFTPTRPPSLPLAVKNPYLSAWFPAGSNGGNGGYLPGQWPSFWT